MKINKDNYPCEKYLHSIFEYLIYLVKFFFFFLNKITNFLYIINKQIKNK